MSLAILTRNLRFTYPDGTEALKGINLEIYEGEKVALIGPNGAGKSTFLLALNGLVEASGEIEVTGLKLNKKNLSKIRSRYGLVFQNPDDQLFCPTVYEDVAFGLMNMGLDLSEIEERTNRALSAIGIERHKNRSSHHLSVGEKKKVAIASVLALEPKIFAFDEPLSNLDPKGQIDLVEIIEKLPQTVIIVTHEILVAKRLCKRVVGMRAGEIFFDIPIEEALEKQSLLLDLFSADPLWQCKKCERWK